MLSEKSSDERTTDLFPVFGYYSRDGHYGTIQAGSVFTILRIIREDDKGVNCLRGLQSFYRKRLPTLVP